MALSIRLKRIGKKKQPFYRVVLQDRRAAAVGVVIEELGTHNPLREPPITLLKAERIRYWVGKGAILTDTVRSILKGAKISLEQSSA